MAIADGAIGETRYLNAIARRNTAWSRYEAAGQLLAAATSAGRPLPPYVANRNDALREYEDADRDLVRARAAWRMERPIAL